MELELSYDSKDDIPTGFEVLYSEKDGKWVLTGVKGLKTGADTAALQTALTKERNDHKTTKATLAKFKDLNPDEIHDQLEELEQLREAGGKAPNEEAIQARIDRAVAKEARKVAALTEELNSEKSARSELETSVKRGRISESAAAAAVKAKVLGTAVEDVKMLAERIFEVGEDGTISAREGSGVVPGTTVDEWLTDLQKTRPHYWPVAEGGGSRGSDGKTVVGANPWSKDHWSITAQGAYIKEHGLAKAEAAAKRAGSKIGATAATP